MCTIRGVSRCRPRRRLENVNFFHSQWRRRRWLRNSQASAAAAEKFQFFFMPATAVEEIQFFDARRRRLKFSDDFFKNVHNFEKLWNKKGKNNRELSNKKLD